MKGSLASRVLVVVVIAAIVPSVTIGVLSVRRARSAVQEEVVNGRLALIRALGTSLDQTLEGARQSLELAAAAWAENRTAETPEDAMSERSSERLLRRLRQTVPILDEVTILNVNGARLAGADLRLTGDLGAHSFGGYIGDVVFEGDQPRVNVAVQARSRTGELAGVFVAVLDLRFIAETLVKARTERSAELLVVDGDGTLIASSNEAASTGENLRATHAAVDRALASARDGSLETDGALAVYRNLSSFQSLRGVRWAILHQQPIDEAYLLAREAAFNTGVIGAVALGLALFLGAIIATRLTLPLKTLAARADALASGGVAGEEAPSPTDAPGEIGHLARRFDEMAARIEERETLRSALARGDRLAAVGTMAAGAAHELGNPLTTVLGYAKLLLEDKGPEHPDYRALTLIADEAARMQQLTGSLLAYARTGTEAANEQALEAVDVNLLLERSSELLAPILKRERVQIRWELGAELPQLQVRAHSLQQVFVNLLHNAAQASPPDAEVTVRTGLAPGDVAVEVEVEDRGPGISEEAKERIFEPFYTTKSAGVGTGLGLAVCKHLVGRFGGSIAVSTGAGDSGALFRVTIPVANRDVLPTAR